jgi:transposase-like protein
MQNKTDSQARKIRGYAIISKGDMPEKLQRGLYVVPSQSNKSDEYFVHHHAYDQWECECPDWKETRRDCKHIFAIRFWLELKDKLQQAETLEPEPSYKVDICPYCQSNKLIRRGIRKNRNVKKQRFSCKSCGRRFVIDIAKHTKGNGKIVTLCLDLYFKGISLRKIQDHLSQFYCFEISHMTIQRWIRKFMAIANQYAETRQPKVSGLWHVDEQMIKSNGDYLWIWNCIDAKTRFLIANNVTESRFIGDARALFSKTRTCGQPDVVVTDGLPAYRKAIHKEFFKVQHVKADGIT